MTVGNIFQLYPIRVELQLNKFCHVENYLWSAPYVITIFIHSIIGRGDVIKGNFHQFYNKFYVSYVDKGSLVVIT